MLYTTGDTHRHLDIHKLDVKYLSQKDYVIVTGDFGLVWNEDDQEIYWRNWLNDKSFTTLFVDGNHENHELLNQYEVKEWKGGKVHFISDSIIHLMRGQVYNIDGRKIFTMGGARSIDQHLRIEGVSWWRDEMPSHGEFEEAMSNLDRHDWKVDFVFTHTTSNKIMQKLKDIKDIKETTPLNNFFDLLEEKLTYWHWYFGHFHNDLKIDEKHTLVYKKIIKIF